MISPNIPAGFCDIGKNFADIMFMSVPMFTKNPNVTKYFLFFNIIFFLMSQVEVFVTKIMTKIMTKILPKIRTKILLCA